MSEKGKAEQWKLIAGYAGRYAVSDRGRIWSKRLGAVLRQSENGRGYCYVCLCLDGRRSDRSAHRLVLEAFRGPCPAGYETGHLNDIRGDNRLENLAWTTSKENARQCLERGRFPIGERHGSARLVPRDVVEIRRLYGSREMDATAIAKKFDIAKGTVYDITSHRSWRHIPQPAQEGGIG